jgi:hypothetical protein
MGAPGLVFPVGNDKTGSLIILVRSALLRAGLRQSGGISICALRHG